MRILKPILVTITLAGMLLTGCTGSQATATIPAYAESALATIQAPPSGSFDCGFPLGTMVYGRPRGLILEPDGHFEFYRQEEPADSEEGQWSYAADLHQIGFAGETGLDYGYYDIGARQLILYLKPDADGQISNLHCVRAQGDPASQP
jgi:hypothetical protein